MKYKFTEETKQVNNITLHRIVAVKDFDDVKAGDIGGWVEKEGNLSQEDYAWVYGNAQVCGNAQVYSDARVCGDAQVYGDARVCGDAQVYGDAQVCGNARVCGDAEVYDDARVCGDAEVYGDAQVCGDAEVYGDAQVCGNAKVSGNAKVYGNAYIFNDKQILVVGPIGSRADFTTFYRDRDGEITVKCGCFCGKINNFLTKVQETHGDNHHAKTYRAAAELAKVSIDLESKIPEESEGKCLLLKILARIIGIGISAIVCTAFATLTV